jgi:hypothetical protein
VPLLADDLECQRHGLPRRNIDLCGHSTKID